MQDSQLICLVKTKYDSGVTQWDVREEWKKFFRLSVHSIKKTLTVTVRCLESYKENDVATTEIKLSSLNLYRTTDKVYNLNPVNNNDIHGTINLKLYLCNMNDIISSYNIKIFGLMNDF